MKIRLQGGPYDGLLAIPYDRTIHDVPEKLPKDIESIEDRGGLSTWRYRRTKVRDADGHRVYLAR